MVTGFFSDENGWNRIQQFQTEEECLEWFEGEGIEVNNPPTDHWWNPSPYMIVGENHQVKQFEGFRYN